jgi:4-amino-4-deoxy-L-arabinose transferase-like glycosyltransferase
MRAEPRGAGELLAWALVPKAALILLLVTVGLRWSADERHVAPRAPPTPPAVWVLARGWDADAYQRIALQGYYDEYSRNYPPGFPALIRAATLVTPDAQAAAVLVSNVAAVLALLVFARLARRLAGPQEELLPAMAVCACLPGLLVWGSVAYSESSAILLGLLGWTAYLRAEEGGGARRHAGWLLAASALFAAAVMVRHLAGATLLGLALVEGLRLLRSPAGTRGRASLEAAAALATVPLLAAYFAWKFSAHDLAGVQRDLWAMGFSPLGGPASLLELLDPETVAELFVTLPLAGLLIVGLARLDPRLAIIAGATLLVSLSFTGIAAQTINRYVWSAWPLALGALRLRDRAAVWALAGVLLLLSAWCGLGHVRGTLAL